MKRIWTLGEVVMSSKSFLLVLVPIVGDIVYPRLIARYFIKVHTVMSPESYIRHTHVLVPKIMTIYLYLPTFPLKL